MAMKDRGCHEVRHFGIVVRDTKRVISSRSIMSALKQTVPILALVLVFIGPGCGCPRGHEGLPGSAASTRMDSAAERDFGASGQCIVARSARGAI